MTDPILVTGAAGALGRAVVAALAKSGRHILAIDLAPDMPDLGQAAYRGGVDLGRPEEAALALNQLVPAGGVLAGLVNIAGGFTWETVAAGSLDGWDRMYQQNLRTAVVVTQIALPFLRAGKGSVVNVGAFAATRAGPGMGAYAASKSGIARLTESLAEEEKDNGVRVNAVLPSIIDTPANRKDMPDADFSRWVTPEALAEVVAFLLSDRSRAITGAGIPVTGWV